MVETWFGRVPNTQVNPDEVVGIGAAIQAMALVNRNTNVLLLDVVPLTLGIEALGGVFIPLIERGTKVPHRVSRVFTTNRDNQDRVVITVLQGESTQSSENTLLATFELTGIRPARRMEPQIEVQLHINVSGILAVTAVDQDTKQSQTVEVVDMMVRAIQSMEDGQLFD
jgi:molecular chaperone DnaK